ncbi:uncharacterized protein [Typha angustifolia]|uniref:uncharacterized protein n=1 Tax=Typha angustifolia TaxID=59011 RepID=UPI003C2D7B8A
MSGAQGAQPERSLTPTTYESVEGGENRTKTSLYSTEDEGGIQIDKAQEKAEDPVGTGNLAFGADKKDDKDDPGVSGTGE